VGARNRVGEHRSQKFSLRDLQPLLILQRARASSASAASPGSISGNALAARRQSSSGGGKRVRRR